MDNRIRVKVDKPGVPPGSVLLRDVSFLAQGLSDTLTRMVQHQLGYPVRSKIRDEAKRLSQIALTGVSVGSGILECQPLPIPDLNGRLPIMVAAVELVEGIREYNITGTWPTTLPAWLRNKIGAATAPVIFSDAVVSLEVWEGRDCVDCIIDPAVNRSLQEPEGLSPDDKVEVVGTIFDINTQSKVFRVNTNPIRVAVKIDEDSLDEVDQFRWKRVFVSGFPEDVKCNALRKMTHIRKAKDQEDDGIVVRRQVERVEASKAFISVSERITQFQSLTDRWDSYKALRPQKNVLEYAVGFLRDAISLLMDYRTEMPVPFVVPTRAGGVQFEWQIGDRELELEIVAPGVFQYLQVCSEEEREDKASRWEAMRLIRWAVMGEEV